MKKVNVKSGLRAIVPPCSFHKSPRDYNRKSAKAALRKEIAG